MRELRGMEQKKKLGGNMNKMIAKQDILVPELIRLNFLRIRAIKMLMIRMKSINLSRMGYWICNNMASTFDALLGIFSDLLMPLPGEDSR